MKALPNWTRLSLACDEIIGDHKMQRWWLLPRNRWFNVYLHRHQGDDPRTPHDHPCDNVSIRLRGELVEHTPDSLEAIEHVIGPLSSVVHGKRCVWFAHGLVCETGRRLRRIRFRRAEDTHRLEVITGRAWTIWIRFRNRRRWGYYEPTGWRPAKTARQP